MATQFYFDSINNLTLFKSFEVKAVADYHDEPLDANPEPKFWSVIGTLTDDVVEVGKCQFPVADFPSSTDAALFLDMCKQINRVGG